MLNQDCCSASTDILFQNEGNLNISNSSETHIYDPVRIKLEMHLLLARGFLQRGYLFLPIDVKSPFFLTQLNTSSTFAELKHFKAFISTKYKKSHCWICAVLLQTKHFKLLN